MSIKKSSTNIFEDLGFEGDEAVELKFKADLYAILVKTVKAKKLTRRSLEKLWDVPQPRVSEVMTGKIDTVSITKILLYLSTLGVTVHPSVNRRTKTEKLSKSS